MAETTGWLLQHSFPVSFSLFFFFLTLVSIEARSLNTCFPIPPGSQVAHKLWLWPMSLKQRPAKRLLGNLAFLTEGTDATPFPFLPRMLMWCLEYKCAILQPWGKWQENQRCWFWLCAHWTNASRSLSPDLVREKRKPLFISATATQTSCYLPLSHSCYIGWTYRLLPIFSC